MTLDELRKAYPAIPADCRANMLQAARLAAVGDKRRLRINARLAVALLLVVSLVGVAYAAERLGIVDYLIGAHQPSEGLLSSAQSVNEKEELDNIAMTVTEALYDGERLSLSWTVENRKPAELVSLRLREITFGGENVDPEFSSISTLEFEDWLPAVFGMQTLNWPRNPVPGGLLSRPLGNRLTGKQELVISLDVSRPMKPIVMLETDLETTYGLAEKAPPEQADPQQWAESQAQTSAELKAMLESMQAAGITLADPAQPSAAWWWEQGYLVVDRFGSMICPEGVTWEDFESEAENPYRFDAFMKESGTLTLRFELDADAGQAFRKDAWRQKAAGGAGQSDIVLADGTVEMDRLSVTPLSTRILFRMYPFENTEEAAAALRETYGWLEVLDENNRALDIAPMEFGTSSPSVHKNEEGQWCLEWDWTMGGVNTYPKEIHFRMRTDLDGEVQPTQQQKALQDAFAEKMVFIEQ